MPKKITLLKARKEAHKTAVFGIASNLLLVIVKAGSGYYGNSFVLIADSLESLTDVVGSIFLLLLIRLAYKPADDNHPYGHGKAEPLTTFLIVAFLIISSVLIIYQAVQNILLPKGNPEYWTLIVLAVIILWKEYCFHRINNQAKKINSSALKSEAWHHRGDAITSLAAFVGITLVLFGGAYFQSADEYAAIFAALIILVNAYFLIKPALNEVMDINDYKELEQKIRSKSEEVEGVFHVEKCFIRKSGILYFVDLHAHVDGNMTVYKSHGIAHQLKDHLLDEIESIGNVLVHIEPEEENL